jgi:hypothetical protein
MEKYRKNMFKIVTKEVTIVCGDVRLQLMQLLSKKYYLNYSIMTLDDMISFAIESNTIKTIEPK